MQSLNLISTLILSLGIAFASGCSKDENNPSAKDATSEFLAKYSNEGDTEVSLVINENGELTWLQDLNSNCLLVAYGKIESVTLHPNADSYTVNYKYNEPGMKNQYTSDRCAPGSETVCPAEKNECERAIADAADRFEMRNGQGSVQVPINDGFDYLNLFY